MRICAYVYIGVLRYVCTAALCPCAPVALWHCGTMPRHQPNFHWKISTIFRLQIINNRVITGDVFYDPVHHGCFACHCATVALWHGGTVV